MKMLALDIGSSSVKAALLSGTRIIGTVGRREFETDFRGTRVEVRAERIAGAVAAAIAELGAAARKVDVIGLAVMSPSWVAMDRKGRAISSVVTHQDRRSVAEAMEIEERVGKERHLAIAGLRPFPGGVSSTTFAWHLKHAAAVMARADLVGHLSTYLHRRLTGARVTDPSNASFMGLYETTMLSGWSEELCEAVGVKRSLLPEVVEANVIAGRLTASGARELGLVEGMPMMAGLMDGSAGMLLAGAVPGRLVNVCGSTDVLAVCTDKARPHEKLLTRALGVGRLWLGVGTIAAAGSALNWAKRELFGDYSLAKFRKLLTELARHPDAGGVIAEPHLAGLRSSIEQVGGAFSGLTLASTRKQMLSALIESLARESAERLPLLKRAAGRVRREVVVTGGVGGGLGEILHRDWPGKWAFRAENEATLRGLGRLIPAAR